METSLRLGGDSKTLRIHAKEKLQLGPKTLLQAQEEIDTSTGAPSCLALIVRQFFPALLANVGVGVQLDKADDLTYNFRGKKAFPITSSGLVGINIKGRLITNKEFRQYSIIGDSMWNGVPSLACSPKKGGVVTNKVEENQCG